MKSHWRRAPWAFLVIFLFLSLAVSASIGQAASFRPEQSTDGAVIATSKYATEAGRRVLRDGGNAIDAAVAVGYTMAVTHPVAGNLGGGGFAIIRMADGKTYSLDFREMAPGKATRNMYLDGAGNVVPKLSLDGYLAAGVPGTVAGMSAMLDKFGTKKLDYLMQPGISFAEKGFVISARNAETFAEHKDRLSKYPSSRKYFLKPDGSTYKEGDVLVQKDLAKTLRLIAKQGPKAFYDGPIAALIEKDMKANGGIMTKDDLKRYKPVWREPVRGTYRGYEIISMGPPSSGGTHIIQMLNILEGYDLQALGPNSAATVNVMAEAMRFAYADRSEYMGDPDFVKVPVAVLTSKEYAERLRSRIRPGQATPSDQVRPGTSFPEGTNTTHYSVVDRWGNAVAITYTINDYYGCAAAVNGAGFLLNNEMDDFAIKPGVPNLYGLLGGDANAVEPYKRPLSSMSPTIVLKDGQVYLVLGSPGGSRIITTVMQVVLNVVSHGMTIREAVDAPRVHLQWIPDELRIEKNGLSADTIEKLTAMGYKVQVRGNMGDVNAIMVDPKTKVFLIASDPRNEF
ncbi:MAG TPA: gamma-glutamyltransferase [Syntrophobacteria bacterium]|nr:gamma-glutamyltransferase [Syntrophobacteria bacterium]